MSFGDVIDACPVIKSGSDFREITKISVKLAGQEATNRNGISIRWEKVYNGTSVEQDPEVQAIVDKYLG